MKAKQFGHGCCLLLALCLGAATGRADQPNIVLILADDMGYGDCGAYNLADDIGEQHDVSQSHPETAKSLFTEFRTFAESRKLK